MLPDLCISQTTTPEVFRKMLKHWALAAIAAIPIGASAQSVVCAGKVINAGITQAEVSAKCGTPAQVDHRTRTVGGTVVSGGQPGYVAGSSEDVQIDLWTYNFGPNKLMQRIWFENGTVTRVESLGYGF
jgi:hypothetical protein